MGYLLPGDLQVEFDGAQVVDVDGHHLWHGSEEVLGLTDHTTDQHVCRQALQLRYLRVRPKVRVEGAHE